MPALVTRCGKCAGIMQAGHHCARLSIQSMVKVVQRSLHFGSAGWRAGRWPAQLAFFTLPLFVCTYL